MIKEAKTAYPVHELIKNRWSARSYSDIPLTEEDINTLIEAASWAPSALNEQPWHYMYALRGTPGFDRMLSCLSPGNQPWAKNAAAILLCISYKDIVRTGQPNRHYMHDAGLANATLALQAISMGIYTHLIGGYDYEKTHAEFSLQENEESVCFITLGFLGKPEQLIEPFKTRETSPRERKPLSQISTDKSFEHDE